MPRARPTDAAARPATPPLLLPDLAAPGLDIVFVGINPSLHSAGAGHHFASRGNPFWRLLHAARLTPTLLRPEEDRRLLEMGIGIISGCARPSRTAAELTAAEQAAGAALACQTIARLRPRLVALLGITLYRVFFPDGAEPGPGRKRARLAGARLFVLPNPSGLNRAYPGFDRKLIWFRRLRRAALAARAAPDDPHDPDDDDNRIDPRAG
jgi:TDG/mug DNA glycosylase family protein